VESVIAALASQTQTSPDEVRKVYDEEREQLRRHAAITQFIDVLAGRRTKARLKKKVRRPS
jgi:hypothetical protein